METVLLIRRTVAFVEVHIDQSCNSSEKKFSSYQFKIAMHRKTDEKIGLWLVDYALCLEIW